MVVGQEPDVEPRKLECHGELVVQLVDNVQELEEDGGESTVLTSVVKVAPMIEPVIDYWLIIRTVKDSGIPKGLGINW